MTPVRNRTPNQGPGNVGLAVTFGPINGDTAGGRYAFEIRALRNYGFEVLREQCRVDTTRGAVHWFDRSRQGFLTNAVGLDPSFDAASLGLPIVGGDSRFAPVLRALAGMRTYAIDPAKLRGVQDPDSGVNLRLDGGNVASVLQEISRRAPRDAERIGKVLAAIVPATRRVRTVKRGQSLSLEFTQEWGDRKQLRFDASSISDGTLRALGLLAAIYQRPSPSLMAVEEPEASMHPGALGAILDLLLLASRRMQLVVTTHSPELLDAKWITDEYIKIVTWSEGATRVTPVAESSRAALQQHLMGAGELLRSNALEAPPLFEDVEAVAERSSLFEALA